MSVMKLWKTKLASSRLRLSIVFHVDSSSTLSRHLLQKLRRLGSELLHQQPTASFLQILMPSGSGIGDVSHEVVENKLTSLCLGCGSSSMSNNKSDHPSACNTQKSVPVIRSPSFCRTQQLGMEIICSRGGYNSKRPSNPSANHHQRLIKSLTAKSFRQLKIPPETMSDNSVPTTTAQQQ